MVLPKKTWFEPGGCVRREINILFILSGIEFIHSRSIRTRRELSRKFPWEQEKYFSVSSKKFANWISAKEILVFGPNFQVAEREPLIRWRCWPRDFFPSWVTCGPIYPHTKVGAIKKLWKTQKTWRQSVVEECRDIYFAEATHVSCCLGFLPRDILPFWQAGWLNWLPPPSPCRPGGWGPPYWVFQTSNSRV